MSPIPQDQRKTPSNSKALTTGFIIAAAALVTASMYAASGMTVWFNAASAQLLTEQINATQQQNQTSTASASPFSEAIERLREQSRLHQQQQAAMNITEDDRQKAQEVSNAVDGALIYYARAIGDENIEAITPAANATVLNVRIPIVHLTGLDEVNSTDAGQVVSQSDYLIAQGLAVKAMESFIEVAASSARTADPVTMQQLADTQQGLFILYGLMQGKAAYNLVEDVAVSPVKTNLEHIYGTSPSTIT